MKIFNNCLNNIRRQNEIVANRQDEIGNANLTVLKTMTIAGFIASGITLLISFIIPAYFGLRIPYGIVFLSTGMYALALYKLRNKPKGLLIAMYTLVGILIGFSIYLSVGESPGDKATIFLAFLIAAPLLIADVSWRVNLVAVFAFFLHLVLAFIFKESYVAFYDMINSLVCLILGVFIGTNMRSSKIQNFELQHKARVLTDTDFLTGLYNRRRMYEDMMCCEEGNRCLCGIILLDIDWFKGFNDHYGHREGDACLKKLGDYLNKFGSENGLCFYRYGGEELIGFSFGEAEPNLHQVSESLRRGILELKIPYPDSPVGIVSVSIGYGLNESTSDSTIEQLIEKVDCALYRAKGGGRNRCCGL